MQIVARVAITYFAILVGLRVLGKRELAQLSPSELVTLLLIPELVSQAIVGADYSVTTALIAIGTLFTLVLLISVVTYLSDSASDAIEGVPAVLVQDGRYVVANMQKERISPDELMAELHRVGLERLEQVKWAVLEAGGSIAIIPNDPSATANVTPEPKRLVA